MHLGLEIAPGLMGQCLEVVGTYEDEIGIPNFSRRHFFSYGAKRLMVTVNEFDVLTFVDYDRPQNPVKYTDWQLPFQTATGNTSFLTSHEGRFLYIMVPSGSIIDSSAGVFWVVDLQNIFSPVVRGSIISTNISAFFMTWIEEGTSIWTQRSGTMPFLAVTLDVTDPDNPFIADTVSPAGMNDRTMVYHSNGGAYGVSLRQGAGYEIWDLNDITDQQLLSLNYSGLMSDFGSAVLGAIGNYVYISWRPEPFGQENVVAAIDLSDPLNPILGTPVNAPTFGAVIELRPNGFLMLVGTEQGYVYAMSVTDPMVPVFTTYPIDYETWSSIQFSYEGVPPDDLYGYFGSSFIDTQGKLLGIALIERNSMIATLDVSCITNQKYRWRPRDIPNQPNPHVNDPVVDMGYPIILYKTRNTDSDGTGFLYNEGSGPDVWDLPLDLFVPGQPNLGYWAIKRRNWGNDDLTTGSNFPTGWDDIGGDPCTAAITFAVAVPQFPTPEESDLYGGEQDLEVLWDSNSTGAGVIQYNLEAIIDSFDDPNWYGGDIEVFGINAFAAWYPEDEGPHAVDANSNMMVFKTVDFRAQTLKLWVVRENDEVQYVNVPAGYQAFDFDNHYAEWPGHPYCEVDAQGEVFGKLFWSVGYHDGHPRTAGVDSWSHVAGALYAHGTPSLDQRRYWYNQFFS